MISTRNKAAGLLLFILGAMPLAASVPSVAWDVVQGQVVARGTGAPLAGATIQVRGTDFGTVSDAQGRFMLKISTSMDSLVVTYVGFADKTVAVARNGRALRIELEPRAISLHDIRIHGTAVAERSVTASRTVVDVAARSTPGLAYDIVDVVKSQAHVAFRGASDLVPDDDTIQLRGFGAKRFATAVDGLTVRKTGGRKSTHIVDYALLPLWNVARVEILPGPHSALYPGNSEGGVMNLITAVPEHRAGTPPSVVASCGLRSYGTRNCLLRVDGGRGSVVYGLGVNQYATDGFLRHDAADLRTSFAQVGVPTPGSGFLDAVASYTDADREIPVINATDAAEYDADFPLTPTADFRPWQEPVWDKEAYALRLHYQQPVAGGRLRAVASWGSENRQRDYWTYVDKTDPAQGTKYVQWETNWEQWAVKLEDEFVPAAHHVSRVGADWTRMYDGYYGQADKKRVDARGLFLQDTWNPLHRLELIAGLRYEDTAIWVSNFAFFSPVPDAPYITTRGPWIKRTWSQYVPKFFATYGLDDMAPLLRNTSLSVGVSKIWRAPLSQPEYNPQMRPAGAWIQPEHGMAYDLIAWRRLWRDVVFKIDYSFYAIRDYIAYNKTYAHYSPGPGNPVEPGREYSDYCINLKEVHRQGLEVELEGHLLPHLSMSANYAYQDFHNQGTEAAAVDVLDARPRHRVNLGTRYRHNASLCMLDYHYESGKVTHAAQDLGADEWAFHDLPIDAYHVWDIAIRQELPSSWPIPGTVSATLYVNNLLNASYQNTDGYPMTDRTVGLTFKLGN